MRIRLAREDELEGLGDLELDAGQRFAELGLRAVSEGDPVSPTILRRGWEAGLLLIAVDGREGHAPIGFALYRLLPGALHLDEVSVARNAAGRGVGAALIEAGRALARERRLTWMTLATFRDVPWNAPYYRRLGFEVVPPTGVAEGEWIVALRALADSQDEVALARLGPRVVMARRVEGELDPGPMETNPAYR